MVNSTEVEPRNSKTTKDSNYPPHTPKEITKTIINPKHLHNPNHLKLNTFDERKDIAKGNL